MSLPPLNALRAFEAAARHLSFRQAAEEMNVTPAAVSQQIRLLEERLECRLFHRLTRSVSLTQEGVRLAPAVADAFARISVALAELRRVSAGSPLTVSVMPSFAVKWLIPKLSRFRALHPEIDVRIAAEDRRADFVTDDVDIAVRFGVGHYPGVHSELILHEDIFPVCSPTLLRDIPPPTCPEDLLKLPLLHDRRPAAGEDWSSWLSALGVGLPVPAGGMTFNQQDMVLQAAMANQGVALSRTHLVVDDLKAGRLVKPLTDKVHANLAYYLVCLGEALETPKVAAFRAWMLSEAAEPIDC
jgi:LysR family transcriptional regulator, glycine cleavage system transcriptional activator